MSIFINVGSGDTAHGGRPGWCPHKPEKIKNALTYRVNNAVNRVSALISYPLKYFIDINCKDVFSCK